MEPFTMALLGGLFGGMGNLFGGQGSYQQIGSPEDVVNINPFTGQGWNALTGALSGAMGHLGTYDYTAPFSYFTQQLAPELQGLTTSGPYAESQMELAKSQAEQVRSQLEQEFGGGGSLFSGAFGQALGTGVASPYLQAVSNITGQQSDLLSQLYGGAMAGLPGMYQMPYQISGNLASQALGGISQYGMPTFYEPNYAYQPSSWERFLGGFGAGTGIAGAFGSIPGGGGGGSTSYGFGNNPYQGNPTFLNRGLF